MSQFELYYGPHLCRALACLEAGQKENAVSWMVRDLGECDVMGPYDQIDPDSLELDDTVSVADGKAIRFKWKRKSGKWIPAAERLPETKGKYLAIFEFGNEERMTIMWFNSDRKEWAELATGIWYKPIKYWTEIPRYPIEN